MKALGNLHTFSEENPFLKFMLVLLMWASAEREANQLGVSVPEHTVPQGGFPHLKGWDPGWREQGTRHTPLGSLPPSAGQQGRGQRPQAQRAEVGLLAGGV